MTGKHDTSIIPSEVEAEKRVIQLFLTYLRQPATKNALIAMAEKKDRFREFVNYIHTLEIANGVEGVMKVAPAFHAVALLSYEVSSSVIPSTARPSVVCIEAALVAYHTWLEAQVGE